MAGAADPLQPTRHRRRCFDLHDEIDRPHVDAELQAARGHQGRQAAGLEQFLDLQPLLTGDRAVMRPDEFFTGELVELVGEPLRQPTGVHEDQR